MTIGADTPLHRIAEALDALRSTASSHQRTFVVEVMGRHCGYLALMASLATRQLVDDPGAAADRRLGTAHVQAVRAGRDSGRRQSVVIVAEGAKDRSGNAITAQEIKTVLEDQLGEDARITILGHVQRGGAPSAFDRYLSTLLGHAAVERLLTDDPTAPAQLVGLRGNRVVSSSLMECVAQTEAVLDRIKAEDFDGAMLLRGGSFRDSYEILRTMQQAAPRPTAAGRRRFRLGVVHGGGPAPGMNNSVRTAVRLGLDRGYTTLAVKNGFLGLHDGDIHEMGWMDVSGWMSDGGAEIGTNSYVPTGPPIGRSPNRLRRIVSTAY